MGLREVWDKWLKISEFIGNIVSRVILTVLYFTIFIIPSVFLTLISDRFGKVFDKQKESYYIEEKIKPENLDDAKEM